MTAADPGLAAAIAAAGSRYALAKVLGVSRAAAHKWTRVPRGRLFQAAQLTGLAPEALRPDLADWIAGELARIERAVRGDGGVADLAAAIARRWQGPGVDVGLVDLWSTMAAVMFTARERGLKPQAVYVGKTKADESARAYAMALAHVVGRASSTNVAGVFQVSRQNVDNASERYIRARDGDDPDDHIQGQFPDQAPRVFEIGSNRLRRAKTGDPALWEAQRRFEAFVAGEATPPERKRA